MKSYNLSKFEYETGERRFIEKKIEKVWLFYIQGFNIYIQQQLMFSWIVDHVQIIYSHSKGQHTLTA